jgi:hypothetical protein
MVFLWKTGQPDGLYARDGRRLSKGEPEWDDIQYTDGFRRLGLRPGTRVLATHPVPYCRSPAAGEAWKACLLLLILLAFCLDLLRSGSLTPVALMTTTMDDGVLAALSGTACVETLRDNSTGATIARAQFALLPETTRSTRSREPEECYYVLSQGGLGMLGERAPTRQEQRNLPSLALLDTLRALPGSFFYALPDGIMTALYDAPVAELYGRHPQLPKGARVVDLRVVISRDALLLVLTSALEGIVPITRRYVPEAELQRVDERINKNERLDPTRLADLRRFVRRGYYALPQRQALGLQPVTDEAPKPSPPPSPEWISASARPL